MHLISRCPADFDAIALVGGGLSVVGCPIVLPPTVRIGHVLQRPSNSGPIDKRFWHRQCGSMSLDGYAGDYFIGRPCKRRLW